jgi:hypothetical protein
VQRAPSNATIHAVDAEAIRAGLPRTFGHSDAMAGAFRAVRR